MDRRMSGQHKGKGPKGYTRSDDRIKEDINDRLSDDVFVDASSIDVTVEKGEVTLTGTVSTRSEKRRSEDIAEQVSGVKNVENRLRLASTVSTEGSWGSSSASSTTSESSSDRSKTKQVF
jgi:osmotically-inducible protein OsmY